jgi:hypothetical protein
MGTIATIFDGLDDPTPHSLASRDNVYPTSGDGSSAQFAQGVAEG